MTSDQTLYLLLSALAHGAARLRTLDPDAADALAAAREAAAEEGEAGPFLERVRERLELLRRRKG